MNLRGFPPDPRKISLRAIVLIVLWGFHPHAPAGRPGAPRSPRKHLNLCAYFK